MKTEKLISSKELEREPQMIVKKSWDEFRNTKMLWIANTILHIFGWAICVDIDPETKKVIDAYPARVRFRGFPDNIVTEGYKEISKYMLDNAEELYKEACE